MAEEKKTTKPEVETTKPVETTDEKKPTDKAGDVKHVKAKKQYRQAALGRAYVKATYNNTIISFTDQNGNVLANSSAGENGFKGPKKATPFAATIIVKKAAEKAQPYGLKEVNVFVQGVGLGREAAIRAINANGLTILSIKDVTPIPHNGCRKPRTRRV
jgi:small subunit ribosomal protein S11